MRSRNHSSVLRRKRLFLFVFTTVAPFAYLLSGCAGPQSKTSATAGSSSGSSPTGSSPGQSSAGSSGTSPSPSVTIAPQQSTIRLGAEDTVTASTGGGTWTVEGGSPNGNIDANGDYTAPTALPANNTVTVDYLLNQKTVSTTISLLNPTPALTGASPNTLTGVTTTVSVSGSGFVPSSQLLLNGAALATTYVDSSHLTAVVTIASPPTSELSLTAANPAPGASTSSPIELAYQPSTMQVTPAILSIGNVSVAVTATTWPAHFHLTLNGQNMLITSTGGNTVNAVGYLPPWASGFATVGVAYDVTDLPYQSTQVPIAATTIPFDTAARFATQAAFGPNLGLIEHIQNIGLAPFVDEQLAQPQVTQMNPNDSLRFLFNNAVDGKSLLRLRVALGLETYIPGEAWIQLAQGIPWEAKLEADAFGNYRQILLDALGDPNVASALNLPGSVASNNPNVHPNQNFAREILQQFSMGGNVLNDDGSLRLDANGNPIPNYDQNTIDDISRMLTGWNYAKPTTPGFTFFGVDYSQPLVANEANHDTGAKTIFGNVSIPAGQTAEEDRQSLVDAIMNQQSTAPFVSRIFIQRLVKSNPTPDYVTRITQVFRDDGKGVSGDMAAVIKAILLDPEAREGDTEPRSDDGILQDPLLFQLFVQNLIHLSNTDDQPIYLPRELGQSVWNPGTVFGYYRPGFMIPATQINSPEFQIFTTPQVIGRSGELMWLITAFNPNGRPPIETQFPTLPELVDALNHIVYHGTMPQYEQDAIESYCGTIQDPTQQFQDAVFIALNSDNFTVTH